MNDKKKRRVRAVAIQQKQQRHALWHLLLLLLLLMMMMMVEGVNWEELVPLAETQGPKAALHWVKTTTTTTVCGYGRVTKTVDIFWWW